MTLKLVHDSNVEELEVFNFKDIAACARKYAEQLEAGLQGEPFRLVVLSQSEDGLGIAVWGENTSSFELMGLFEAAKFRVLADDALGDE